MVDGADSDVWSDVADGWAHHWGRLAAPAWDALIDAAGIGPGTRVLDVGCGAGELLGRLSAAGARATGVDPAPGMVALARRHADAVVGDAEDLPFPDAAFDVVVAVNALQFADDTTAALHEFARVVGPGGRIGIANWADAAHNAVDAIEAAVAADDGDEPTSGGPLRDEGGLERALADAGLGVEASGLVLTPWWAADADELVAAILLGEDADVRAEKRAVVVGAAEPYRRTDGSYELAGAFRWAVARVSPVSTGRDTASPHPAH